MGGCGFLMYFSMVQSEYPDSNMTLRAQLKCTLAKQANAD
jgi:hypothetical protein